MVEVPVVILRVQVIGCKNLVAKDSGGTSDPCVHHHIICFAWCAESVRRCRYVVAQLPLWREKFSTPVVNKTLNPTFDAADATFDFPIFLPLVHVGAALKLKVWDKDYIMSDYLGEAVIDIDNWFEDGVVRGFQDSNNTVRLSSLPTRTSVLIWRSYAACSPGQSTCFLRMRTPSRRDPLRSSWASFAISLQTIPWTSVRFTRN